MRKTLAAALCVLSLTCLCGCAATGWKDSVDGRVGFKRPLSFVALRFEATIPQGLDFTCGAASIATLLTYYWNDPTSENDAIEQLRRRYTVEELKARAKDGLSFNDLILIAEGLGYSATGAKIPASELPMLGGPVIVHLEKADINHFAVLRKVGDGVYYLSDPTLGQTAMNAGEFERQYSGNALAIWKKGAALPASARLLRPRDGISVTNSLGRVLNEPIIRSVPTL